VNLNIQGLQWADSGEIVEDTCQSSYNTKINWSNNISVSIQEPIDCFFTAFSMLNLQKYVAATNQHIQSLSAEDREFDTITDYDILKYFAIRLYHCIECPNRPIHDCFNIFQDPLSFEKPLKFGELFEMPRTKFAYINKVFRVATYNDVELEEVCVQIFNYYHID